MDTVPHHAVNGNLYYVYTLAYPDDYPDSAKSGVVFYVGKGTQKGRYNRLKDHEREATNPQKYCRNMAKVKVIQEIWESGRQVSHKKVAFFDDEEAAYIYEWGLINLVYPSEYLTNIAFNSKHPRLLGQYRITLSREEMLELRPILFNEDNLPRVGKYARGGEHTEKSGIPDRPDYFARTPGKHYEGLRSPDGTEYRDIPVLHRFCDEHRLDVETVWKLIRRQIPSYCGWIAL